MKHTKGPWKKTTGPGLIGTVLTGSNFKVADCLANDAALIAAAPELLAGLISTILYIETYGGEVTENFAGKDNVNLQFYKDLIKKATNGGE